MPTVAIDDFANNASGLTSPLIHAALVTPDDANDLAHVSREILIGGTGNVEVMTLGGEHVIIPSVSAGRYAWRIKRIYATSTTATNITAFW